MRQGGPAGTQKIVIRLCCQCKAWGRSAGEQYTALGHASSGHRSPRRWHGLLCPPCCPGGAGCLKERSRLSITLQQGKKQPGMVLGTLDSMHPLVLLPTLCSLLTGVTGCASSPLSCGAGACVLTPEGYSCLCHPGYTLDPSGLHCVGRLTIDGLTARLLSLSSPFSPSGLKV